MGPEIRRPLHGRGIRTHRRIADDFRIPGVHVKPLLPSRSTTVFPCESVSTMRADLAISVGPADMARAILA
jgi:hypothetical protein